METIAVVLSVGKDQVAAFERASETTSCRSGRTSRPRGDAARVPVEAGHLLALGEGAIQYLIVVVFATGEGHHQHDNDPRFAAWNEMADAYQVGSGWPSAARRSCASMADVSAPRAFPTPAWEITHILVVADADRSRAWYVDVLGAELNCKDGGTSAVLTFAGTWLLLVTGGEPTADKPTVTFAAPADPGRS